MLELALMSLGFSLAGLALARGLELVFRDPRDRQWLWRIALLATACDDEGLIPSARLRS